ncbi:MAG TPA: ABC transporter ATP-binding protein [Candidatus Hydrogenedentes bacterium]|nr:ABC transporter ATP-binding protein [Candidatus Hydrogenedentota bacterium]
MDVCVCVENLRKRYGKTEALRGISFEVRRHEILGLLGPNGAGKSTTLGILCGLVRPTAGRVTVFGMDLARHRLAALEKIGALLERPAFPPRLTVRRLARLHARLKGLPYEEAEQALHRVGLSDWASVAAGRLSLGLRQRLGLALAILGEPELLILDEPTLGMDVESAGQALDFLRQLAREGGATILFSSHRMGEVERLCDRVAIIREGEIVSVADTAGLLAWNLGELEIFVDRPEEALSLIRSLPETAEAELEPSGMVRVRLKESGASHAVTRRLVEAGFQVRAVIPARRTLELHFREVTGS